MPQRLSRRSDIRAARLCPAEVIYRNDEILQRRDRSEYGSGDDLEIRASRAETGNGRKTIDTTERMIGDNNERTCRRDSFPFRRMAVPADTEYA
jgi:hypothetical protein